MKAVECIMLHTQTSCWHVPFSWPHLPTASLCPDMAGFSSKGGCREPSACRALRGEEYVSGGFFLLTLGSDWRHFSTCCTPRFFFVGSQG